jgi:hypothetical protein
MRRHLAHPNLAITEINERLGGRCVFVGSVVDWYHLRAIPKDIDLVAMEPIDPQQWPQAREIDGFRFGHRWRTIIQGWYVEIFDPPACDFDFVPSLGVNIQKIPVRVSRLTETLATFTGKSLERKEKLRPRLALYEKLNYVALPVCP